MLQHRAEWSHHGGTWGVPGGAISPGERPVDGALREAAEEAGIPPDSVALRATWRLSHPDWSYTTVLAEAQQPVEPRATDAESLDVQWIGRNAVTELALLPAFADTWPKLRPLLGRRLVIVVDAANTVGSRPDGWWRDRRGATERLRNELATLAFDGVDAEAVGLAGHRWFPHIVLVAEGAARGVSRIPGVEVVAASGEGDDEIVAQVAHHTRSAEQQVVVVTADRQLRQRVAALGAAARGPRLVVG